MGSDDIYCRGWIRAARPSRQALLWSSNSAPPKPHDRSRAPRQTEGTARCLTAPPPVLQISADFQRAAVDQVLEWNKSLCGAPEMLRKPSKHVDADAGAAALAEHSRL